MKRERASTTSAQGDNVLWKREGVGVLGAVVGAWRQGEATAVNNRDSYGGFRTAMLELVHQLPAAV